MVSVELAVGCRLRLTAITKYETENRQSVRWYIEMQGERIEVTTPQLLDQRQLQKICVEKLNKCPAQCHPKHGSKE